MFWEGREHRSIKSMYNFFLVYFGGRRTSLKEMTRDKFVDLSYLQIHLRSMWRWPSSFSLSNFCHPENHTVVFWGCYTVGWGRAWSSGQCACLRVTDLIPGGWVWCVLGLSRCVWFRIMRSSNVFQTSASKACSKLFWKSWLRLESLHSNFTDTCNLVPIFATLSQKTDKTWIPVSCCLQDLEASCSDVEFQAPVWLLGTTGVCGA